MDLKKIFPRSFATKFWLSSEPRQVATACVQKLSRNTNGSKNEASPRPEHVAPLRKVCNMKREYKAAKLKHKFETSSNRSIKAKSKAKGMLKSVFQKKNVGVNLTQEPRMVNLPKLKLYKKKKSISSYGSSQRRYERFQPRKDVFMTGLSTSILNVAELVKQPVRNQHMQVKTQRLSKPIRSSIQCDLLPIDSQTKNLIALNKKPTKVQQKMKQADDGNATGSWEHPPSTEPFDMDHDNQFKSVHEEIQSQYRKLKRVNELKQFENLRRVAHLNSGLNNIAASSDFNTVYKPGHRAKLDHIVKYIKQSDTGPQAVAGKPSASRLTQKAKAAGAGRAPVPKTTVFSSGNKPKIAAKNPKTGNAMNRKKTSNTPVNTSVRREFEKPLPKRYGVEMLETSDGLMQPPFIGAKSNTKLAGGNKLNSFAKPTPKIAAKSNKKLAGGNSLKTSAKPSLNIASKANKKLAGGNLFKTSHNTTLKSNIKLASGNIFGTSSTPLSNSDSKSNTKLAGGNIFKSGTQVPFNTALKSNSNKQITPKNVFKPSSSPIGFDWKKTVQSNTTGYGKLTDTTATNNKPANAGGPNKKTTEPKYNMVATSVGKKANTKPQEKGFNANADRLPVGGVSATPQPANLKTVTSDVFEEPRARPHKAIPTASYIACSSVPEPNNSRFAHFNLMRGKTFT